MQVKSIAEGEHSAILSTFIKLPFVIKICVLSIFAWSLNTGFTVTGNVVLRAHETAFVDSRNGFGYV